MYLPEALVPSQTAPYELPASLRPKDGQREAWKALVAGAIESGDFRCVAQPIFSVAEGRFVRWELLTRLQPADGPRVPPSAFLPLAAELGLQSELDRSVLRRAVELLAVREGLHLSVNVSAASVADADLVAELDELLRVLDVEPARLMLELAPPAPGSGAQSDGRSRESRFRIALDDFAGDQELLLGGVGLWADTVKIDSALTRRLVCDDDARRSFAAAIAAAHRHAREVVVTRIPDRATAAMAIECGAAYLQGFEVGRPRPLTALP